MICFPPSDRLGLGLHEWGAGPALALLLQEKHRLRAELDPRMSYMEHWLSYSGMRGRARLPVD